MKEKTEVGSAEIKKLEQSIALYDRNIKRNPNNTNSQPYYMKAKDLFELGKIIKDNPDNFKQSLECYSKAIELDPKNSLYYTKRGELHAHMGNTELAALDIRESNKFPSLDDIASIYMQNTKRDIAKLTSVQDAIAKLKENGQINDILAEAFLEHTKVTEGLVVSVGVHGETLDIHNHRIEKLEAMLAQVTKSLEQSVQEKNELDTRLTAELRKETNEIKGVLADQSAKIETIESKVTTLTLTTSTEFNDLSHKLSNLEVNKSLFEGRLKIAEGKLDTHDNLLITIDDTLKQANVYKEQEVKEGFEQLKTFAPNEVLYKYANSFHWALSNYLLAYRAIGTGMVEGVREKSKFEEVWSKVGGVVTNTLGIVPVVGGILPMIESGLSIINDTYQGLKFDRKVEKINSIITHSVLEKDLSLAVASSSIQIAKIRQSEIITNEKAKQNPQGSQTNKSAGNLTDKAMTKFNKEIDKLLTKAAHITKTELTPAQAMAVKDVILFINYIATHDDAIKIINNGQGLDRAITEILCNHALLEVPQSQKQSNSQSSNKNSNNDCIVCKVDHFTYDNELLNHPELLKLAASYYGSSKAIDLGSKLSQALVKQAATSSETMLRGTGEMGAGQGEGREGQREDAELLLAGLMSLDQSEGSYHYL